MLWPLAHGEKLLLSSSKVMVAQPMESERQCAFRLAKSNIWAVTNARALTGPRLLMHDATHLPRPRQETACQWHGPSRQPAVAAAAAAGRRRQTRRPAVAASAVLSLRTPESLTGTLMTRVVPHECSGLKPSARLPATAWRGWAQLPPGTCEYALSQKRSPAVKVCVAKLEGGGRVGPRNRSPGMSSLVARCSLRLRAGCVEVLAVRKADHALRRMLAGDQALHGRECQLLGKQCLGIGAAARPISNVKGLVAPCGMCHRHGLERARATNRDSREVICQFCTQVCI